MNLIPPTITPQLSQKLQDKLKHSAPFLTKGSSPIWKNSPSELDWNWANKGYAQLPFSSKNTVSRFRKDGKWDVIQKSLIVLKTFCEGIQKGHQFDGSIAFEFEKCISSYNTSEPCNFKILNNPELREQLVQLVPMMVDQCLELPSRLSGPIPLLKKGNWHTMFLTRRVCCSLLANAFFCMIPHESRSEDELPNFHFLRLFDEGDEGEARSRVKIEKIKCVLQYFERVGRPGGVEDNAIISFERKYLPHKLNWGKSEKHLCKVAVNGKDEIEKAEGKLQVDFANMSVGGGILWHGMVQEEIRFATCPDLIVSRFFTELLGDDEVLVVTGAKQFSDYEGSKAAFRMKKMKRGKEHKRDALGREPVELVAMDALYFSEGMEWTQYHKNNIDRELHKAFVGFYTDAKDPKRESPSIATGNWGCGAFNGDPHLKMIIQWMAASEVGRYEMEFHTFGDVVFGKEIKELCVVLAKKKINVGKLYKFLDEYETKGNAKSASERVPVFRFVKEASTAKF